MPSNSFSREEIVAFDQLLEGFEDQEVLSRNVSIYSTNQTMMARTGDVIWRPQPYISQSFDGMDQTNNFGPYTQLSVPATIGISKSVPWIMDAKELRDALQEKRLGDSAKQKLASDINIAIMNVASAQGTLVVPISTAAGTYDNVALCDSIMNEQGVVPFDRYLALSSRDYNGMAGNLVGTARSFGNNKSDKAYERSYVGMVASFDTYKLDYANRIGVAGGGATNIDTQASAGNYYVPQGTSTASTGEWSNVDNRFQTITVDNTVGIAAGDCFTIAGVEAVHHITKQSTGQLKTFRVISVTNGTQMVICPPIISGQGGSDAELQYKNVEVTPDASADFTWLNIHAANINPFWQKDALEILPGRYAVPTDAGAAVMRGTTTNGIEIVMSKFFDIDTLKTKFRVDTLFGVVNKQPEMSGILIFGQA
ncbi:P22 phage major capsid protein family protein [Rhizorhabdus histidinilytica]|uniref:P22 phage major capsid protein family protein n=1 Tax=Rhizorhabdus histidinilytica TaxID=439228 RepID=UPI00321F9BFB